VAAIRYILWAVLAFILGLRYRIRIEGLEKVRGLKKTVIFPNHPGLIDPPNIFRALWPALKPRPMVLASEFHNPVLFWIPKVLNAVLVPDTTVLSRESRQKAENSVATMIQGLKDGDNIVLWPAGRIYRDDHEYLGAARALSDIYKAVPDANVVMVRTRGIWGSRFTFAYTGGQPSMLKGLLAGIGVLISNLIFFAPRREIHMTVELLDRSKLPVESTREQINAFFEEWYNRPGHEKPTFVPYHFLLGPRERKYPPLYAGAGVDLSQVKEKTRDDVLELIEHKIKRKMEGKERLGECKLDNLGLDSLDRMEITLEIESQFGFSTDVAPQTVGDYWAMAAGLLSRSAVKPLNPKWFSEPTSRARVTKIDGQTLLEALMRRWREHPRDVVAADDASGVVDYERFMVGVQVLGGYIKETVKVPYVGVMMPASVAGDMLIFAVHWAGKTPVMMNWTTGPGNLAHAAKVMGLTHVVTSRKFIDRTGIDIAEVQYLYLEEARERVGRRGALKMFLKTRFMPRSTVLLAPKQDPEKPAVILFTSGSEKAPKAVPLSHRNIISNINSALEAYNLGRGDALLGFLPSFHSFGVTVTALLPILAGARVVHHPDPTDASLLVRKIKMYKPTILCGTPTFVGFITARSRPGDLDSLRLMIVGAEKCPQSLFDKMAALAPKVSLLEGYGITECAPLVAGNRAEDNRPGTIGKALPGVKAITVDPDTFAPLGPGQMGMLLVNGPNVFSGYIGFDGPSPFREVDGSRYYVTGDLATIATDGVITFTGRLKRFLKAGGEMISLPSMEEPFAQKFPPTTEGPQVAVEGIEGEHGKTIVLFSTQEITLREANTMLQAAGMRGVIRLDEVRRIEKIPVLGTGKTDYKVLKAMIVAK
jgi:acyl-CoA synthetase (AMP-forming)/AMP-acid ligase II/1-acyl-sn-glycerol-3-phosphate acyltransferase/acyl carrier protein